MRWSANLAITPPIVSDGSEVHPGVTLNTELPNFCALNLATDESVHTLYIPGPLEDVGMRL